MMTRLSFTLLIFSVLSTGCQRAASTTPLPPSVTIPASSQPSATAVLSPTSPAPTQTPVPAPLTFTENFDGSLPNWSFLQIDNGQTFEGPGLSGGYLVFDLPSVDQWAYALYARPDYSDVLVDTQVEIRTGGDGAIGVVCRYSETAGWYELNIYFDQSYSLLFGQWLGPGVAHYTPIFKGTSDKIKNDTNEIGLLCQGDILTPFINGVQLKQTLVQNFGLKEGTIGISASSFQNIPFSAAFDWVKVSLP